MKKIPISREEVKCIIKQKIIYRPIFINKSNIFQHVKDFEDLVRTVVTMCNGDEQERLREMEDWIVKNEGTWVLAEGFNSFLGNVLHKADWPSDARVAMLRLLAYGAEQDDIVLILHMDRKDHLVMNYAQQFDRLPIREQESLAMLVGIIL